MSERQRRTKQQQSESATAARPKDEAAHTRHRDLPRRAAPASPLWRAGNNAVNRLLDGSAQPLPPHTRAEMEEAFQQDFGAVRVHRDAAAQSTADALDASALTRGEDIYLGPGAPAPDAPAGRELLAHELAHVVQQRRAGAVTEEVSRAGDRFEQAADYAARQALRGQTAEVAGGGAPPAIQLRPRNGAALEEPTEEELGNPVEFIHRQLRRKFSDPDDPRLSRRRRWLNRAFRQLDSSQAKPLLDRLTKKTPGDDVYDGFQALHRATRKELLDILREKIAQGESYQKKLREAVTRLQGVKFGRCEGGQPGPDPRDKYDDRYWEEVDVTDPKATNKQAELVLKPRIEPAEAIDEMFDNLDRWSFDCAQFVQVAELYALRHSLGDETFNTYVSSRGRFTLRRQWATGVETKTMWGREQPGEPLTRFDGPDTKARETKSVDRILAEAPDGSRIVWTNADSRANGTDFKNENAIKLGPDRFAAHPWGELSRKEIELKLAQATEFKVASADDDYVKKNIFISRIEHYRTP